MANWGNVRPFRVGNAYAIGAAVMVNIFVRDGGRSFLIACLCASCSVFAALSGFAGQSVTLGWNPSPTANVAGYNVYYGANSLQYTNLLAAGNSTNLLISGLVEGATYYFAATAFDDTGVESDFSPEVSYWVPATNANPTLPPTISAIGNQIIQKNSSLGPIAFVVTDPDTADTNLTLTAFSSYPLLVPVGNIVFGGSGADRTVTVTPAANRSGAATIGIIVTDDAGNSRVSPFSLTVLPSTGSGGSTPVVSTLPDATLNENGPGTNLSFVVLDADTPIANVSVTVATDNPLLFPAANLSLLGSGANRVLRVTPALNRSGTGQVTVSATDDLGHTGTTTTTVTVLPGSANSSLLLLTSGSGTVTPNLGAQSLTAGKRYSVTAKPAAGNLFIGWSGDLTASSATLNFTLAPGMTLQANFIPSPYIPASGSYTALFAENAGVQAPSAGALTATITRSGAYSGKLRLAGGNYSFGGKMNLQCQSTNRIKRGTNILTLVMQADQAGQISGHLAQDAWLAPLQGVRAGYNAKTNPAPQTGRYTMMMHGHPGDSSLPAGHSFASVKVSSNGQVSFTGALADGSKVTQSAFLSKDGLWPFYVPVDSGKGLMICWLTYRAQNGTDFDGWLAWIKPANPAARFYPAGFDYERNVFGETYVPPVGTNVLLNAVNLQVPFAFGNLPGSFANQVHLESGNKVVNTSANKLAMTFSLSTGVYQGKVNDPILDKVWSFSGVVLQKDNAGYGFLSGTNSSSATALFPN